MIRFNQRAAGVVVCAALTLVGCEVGGDDATPDTVPDTVPDTAPDTAPDEEIDEPQCIYRSDLVLARGATSGAVIAPGILVTLTPDELAAILGYDGGTLQALLLADMLTTEQITAYEVVNAGDPLQIARAIEQDMPDLELAPVLLTTIASHWTFAPGAAPLAAANAPASTPSAAFTPTGLPIAVIDTGYTETVDTPDWLAARVDPVDARFDADEAQSPKVAGHGKFVASIIAQEDPNVAISVARLGNTKPIPWFGRVPDLINEGFATDELQFYLAVARLSRPRSAPEYAALNVSAGSYACPADPQQERPDPEVDDTGLAVRAAVDLWTRTQPGRPIVAAAGNHEPGHAPPSVPFLPGAYDDRSATGVVVQVGSSDQSQALSSFSNPALLLATGERLLGVSSDDGSWTAWSGSSFATALVTAQGVPQRRGVVTPKRVVAAP